MISITFKYSENPTQNDTIMYKRVFEIDRLTIEEYTDITEFEFRKLMYMSNLDICNESYSIVSKTMRIDENGKVWTFHIRNIMDTETYEDLPF